MGVRLIKNQMWRQENGDTCIGEGIPTNAAFFLLLPFYFLVAHGSGYQRSFDLNRTSGKGFEGRKNKN